MIRLVGGALGLALAVSGCATSHRPAPAASRSRQVSATAGGTASAGPTGPADLPSATPTPGVTATPTRRATTPSPSVTRSGFDYAFPVRGCSVSYARSHHDYPATDVFAARGCAFVAPVAGRVDEVTYTDRWSSSTNRGADRGGLSVSVVGDDGVRYYGSHLAAVARGVRPGLRVVAGFRLGSVGNTGSARGIATHLHFGLSWPTRPGIWWVRRGEVYPWPYLDSWRAGGDRSPAVAVRSARAAAGSDVPRCTSYC